MTVNNSSVGVKIVCADAKISNGNTGFLIFLLGMLQKMSNISCLCGKIFLNSFDLTKKIRS